MATRQEIEAAETEQKKQIIEWISAVIGEKIDTSQPFEKVLKDGQYLCKLINKLVPGHVKKINSKGGNFALLENLAAFQKGMRVYGVPEDELFQPVDLFEARNVKAVVKSLAALARLCLNKGFDGPAFGPKMSDENKREFTAEQGRANRDGFIGLQAGQNKGATAAGINMGKGRSIND
jgi:hypothetical protein